MQLASFIKVVGLCVVLPLVSPASGATLDLGFGNTSVDYETSITCTVPSADNWCALGDTVSFTLPDKAATLKIHSEIKWEGNEYAYFLGEVYFVMEGEYGVFNGGYFSSSGVSANSVEFNLLAFADYVSRVPCSSHDPQSLCYVETQVWSIQDYPSTSTLDFNHRLTFTVLPIPVHASSTFLLTAVSLFGAAKIFARRRKLKG